MATLTKTDNIKNLYAKIKDKKAFRKLVAKEFGIAESTARTGWFTRFEIPERYNIQDKVIELLQNTIKHSNEDI